MRETTAVIATARANGWPRWALALFVAITFALGNSVGSCATANIGQLNDRVRAVEVWGARIESKLDAVEERLMRIERKIDGNAAR